MSWKRLERLSIANRKEWERLIADPSMQKQISRLRGIYGFPKSKAEVIRWFDTQHEDVRNFNLGFENIVKNHSVPKKWHSNLRCWIIYNGHVGIAFSVGFPVVEVSEEGQMRIIIENDTHVSNPFIVKELIRLQMKNDPVPNPRKIGRKRDYGPVYEWHLKHPDVSQKEIARIIGCRYDTLRKRFSEVSGEYD